MSTPPPTNFPLITGGVAAITSFLHEDSTITRSQQNNISRSLDASASIKNVPPHTTDPPRTGGAQSPSISNAKSNPLNPTAAMAVPALANTSTFRALDDDDAISSDDNRHEHSNSSSTQVTPSKSKRLRFTRRTSTQSTTPSHTSTETGVLSCQLALLAALTAEMENSVNVFEKDQWKARIFQINQVVQMVQWEANGLYGLADDN